MSHTEAEHLTSNSLLWYFSSPRKTICASDPPSNTGIDTLSQTPCVPINLIF